MGNSSDDFILLLDDGDELTLVDDSYDELTLVDDIPHVKHYNYYTGAYEVTPILYNEQVLDTDDKVLEQDVTVHPIPINYILNQYGGITVVIG